MKGIVGVEGINKRKLISGRIDVRRMGAPEHLMEAISDANAKDLWT